MNFALSAHRFRPACIAGLALVLSTSALAWKPKTHIYLADLALQDALDGKIEIFTVNHETGQVLGKLGEYAVDPDVISAIRNNRRIFNAGVLGPDVYPDLITGQCIIHPENSLDEGSNSWLTHIWNRSRTSHPKVKAFVAGYLFHAAGDMYAHTFMNHFAGGDFEIGTNALRHLVLEGYIGKLTPTIAEKQFTIFEPGNDQTVRNWIYTNMMRADIGTALENKLLIAAPNGGPGAKLSVPRVFSRLRNYLVQEKAALGLAREKSRPLSIAKRAYIDAWIDDIDTGLKAWPLLSERIAGLLAYNLNESMTTAEMKKRLTDHCNAYVNNHLLSMIGLPDFVGMTRAQVSAFTDAILDPFKDAVDQLKRDLANALVKAATGFTLDELADKINRPEVYFDSVLGPGSLKNSDANNITRVQVDALLQKQANGFGKFESFAPAYNTILMTKLILLSKPEMNRLIGDLRAARLTVPVGILNRGQGLIRPGTITRSSATTTLPIGMAEDNAMLGFILKMDGANQWRLNGSPLQMSLVKTGVYNKVFVYQTGEHYDPVTPPSPPLPSGTIKVTITRVRSIDNLDPIIGQGQADFYGRIEIDDKFRMYPTIDNRNEITPNWTLTNPFVGETAEIRIRLFEEDLIGDDVCDINPRSGVKRLKLFYNLRTGKITGDATGNKGQTITVRGAGDSNKAEISFKIEH